MGDKISVIVPVFNNEKYIGRCLKSICENSYENLEIIVVDDGSSDQSGNICDEYAKKDFRIKVVHQKNQGVSKSRNNGIHLATGNYITFVDSDDFISSKYFEVLKALVERTESELAICKVNRKESEINQESILKRNTINLKDGTKESKEVFYLLNSQYLIYGPYNKLFKKNIIEKNNIHFPEDTSYGEDLIFNFAYLEYCNIISYTEECSYYYNTDAVNSLSKCYRINRFENGLRINSCIEKFAKKYNLWDEHLSGFLARRIYDDAYNSLFDIYRNKSFLTIKQKYSRVKEIMHSNTVIDSIKIAYVEDYCKLYTFLMRHKMALIFVLLSEFRNVILNRRGGFHA